MLGIIYRSVLINIQILMRGGGGGGGGGGLRAVGETLPTKIKRKFYQVGTLNRFRVNWPCLFRVLRL